MKIRAPGIAALYYDVSQTFCASESSAALVKMQFLVL